MQNFTSFSRLFCKTEIYCLNLPPNKDGFEMTLYPHTQNFGTMPAQGMMAVMCMRGAIS